MTTSLPEIIETYFKFANTHDIKAVITCFNKDAIVLDEGQKYKGIKAIESWKKEVTEKYKVTSNIIDFEEIKGRMFVTTLVSGGFAGSPTNLKYAFNLSDGKIAKLECNPRS